MSATDPWNYPVKLYLEESPLWLDFHQIVCQEKSEDDEDIHMKQAKLAPT